MSEIIAQCIKIANSHFLNTPYNEQSSVEFAEKVSEVCHYCTAETLNAILKNNCLRFTDVRFLNDSTEFIEVIPLIEETIMEGDYTPEFQDFILKSNTMCDLKEYKQSYVGVSRKTHDYQHKIYRTYTCSFSYDRDSLNMWNYYAMTAAGISVSFDYAWNMFKGSEKLEANIGEKLDNDIIIYRGMILYKKDDKKKCIARLLDYLKSVFKEAQGENEKYKDYILYAFKESINHMRCFFKNEHFSCENEYRVVLKIPEELLLLDDSSNVFKEKGVFKRGNTLIPYVDYVFRKESIKSITLNPYVKEENSILELGIKELLWMNQMDTVNVLRSSIPLRKWD